ncbi:hypothetical protein RZS08_12265, partial [Arthrospira platensis SPKY1]|nr:hypothetical protein [Arthrospira platensis SPKY1]
VAKRPAGDGIPAVVQGGRRAPGADGRHAAGSGPTVCKLPGPVRAAAAALPRGLLGRDARSGGGRLGGFSRLNERGMARDPFAQPAVD